MEPFKIPFYLGKGTDKKDDSYYFVGTKDGEGRFLKYTRYPFWAGPSNIPPSFAFVDAPESVVKEVEAFAAGKLLIEVIPKSRGRSEKVIKTEAVPLIVLTQEKDENLNVTNINSSTGTCLVKDSAGKIRTRSKVKTEISSESKNDCNSTINRIPPSSESSRITETTGGGPNLRESAGSISTVRRLSSDGDGSSIRSSKSESDAGSSAPKSRKRRVSGIGILVQGGNDSGSNPLPPSDDKPIHSVIDGSLNKPKRHRRTKAEMLLARATEVEVQST